ncbi:MAG: hypothetical protein IJG31_01380 [Fusobacterium sp.]|nr:hypothetical protein [Fusobacterium sp.]
MRNKIVLLDDFPITFKTVEAYDYLSKIVVSYINEPFFSTKFLKISSKYIKHRIINNFLIFKILPFFWSNGEKVSAKDIYRSILYFIKEKKAFSYNLFFIKNVENYLNGISPIENIGIFLRKDKIFFKLIEKEQNYAQIFSLIHFSPIYLKENKINLSITTGEFKLNYIDRKKGIIHLKKNEFYPSNTKTSNIIFKVIKDPNKALEFFYKNKDTIMTCSTCFPYLAMKNHILDNNFIKRESNIRVFFKINMEKIRFKSILFEYLKKYLQLDSELSEGIKWNFNYIGVNDISKNFTENFEKKIFYDFKDPVRILYTDYYPNTLIVKYILDFFKEKK